MSITTEELAKIETRLAGYFCNTQLISELTMNQKGGLKRGAAHALACACTPQILQEVEIQDERLP